MKDDEQWGAAHEYENPEQVFAFSSKIGDLLPEVNKEYSLTLGRMFLKQKCDLALELQINGKQDNPIGCLVSRVLSQNIYFVLMSFRS
jgi:hypothetical protein